MKNYNNIIIFTNPDHSGSIFKKLREQFCSQKERKPYVAFELKKIDTFWYLKEDLNYFSTLGKIVKINNIYYKINIIKFFSYREELKNFFDSMSQKEKERVITYNPFFEEKKGYFDLI